MFIVKNKGEIRTSGDIFSRDSGFTSPQNHQKCAWTPSLGSVYLTLPLVSSMGTGTLRGRAKFGIRFCLPNSV